MSTAAAACMHVVVQERVPGRRRSLGLHGRYLPTVAWLTSMPSLSSSPWMRAPPKADWPGSSGGLDHGHRG